MIRFVSEFQMTMYWWLFRLNWPSPLWESFRSLSWALSVAPCSNKVMSMTAFSSFCSLLLSVFVLFLLGSRKLSHSSLLGAQHFHFPSFLHCVCVCGRYLDMLPTRFGNPLWFSDDDFLELKGTNLYDATLLQVNPLSCLSCDFFSLHLIIIIILKMNSFSCLFQKKKLLSLYHDKVEPLLNKLLLLDGVSERSTGFNIFKLLCSSSWPPNHFSFFFFFGLFLQQCFLWPFPLVCSLVISFFFF